MEQAEDTVTPDGPLKLAPTGVSERIASLDFIRGFAVLGILAANIVAFGQPTGAYMWPGGFLTAHGAVSDWLWIVQFVLVDGKMRGLFTLLFGAGLALFAERMADRGTGIWLQLRRLGWLLVFGLLHFFFVWKGDILTLYALLGFVALLFVHWSAQRQLVVGLMAYVIGALIYGLSFSAPFFIADTPMGDAPSMAVARAALDVSLTETLADDAVEVQILTDGTYAEFVAHNLADHAADPFNAAIMFALDTLPLMVIGMALYRVGLFSGGLDRGRQLRWGWIGVIAGSAITLAIALWIRATGFTYWGTMAAFMSFSLLPRLAVILGLAALLALWGAHARGWLGQRISAAGRMAFSNYLGTSVLMVLVFHPWAGGLWGELNRPQLYLVVLAGWGVMLAWSLPWLARFRYGPLEWLWRCLSYGRLFPLRRVTAAAPLPKIT